MSEKSVYKDILYGFLFLGFALQFFAFIISFIPDLIKGPSAILFQGLLLIFLLATSGEVFRRMKTFPEIPWWTWLILIFAVDLLQTSLMFLSPRTGGTTTFTSRALTETATLLFPVIISVFAWKKNQETPSYILYGILVSFITHGVKWALPLVMAGIQWTGAPYWVAILLMSLAAFSFIAYVLLRKTEFPRIGKTVMALSIIAGALWLGVWLFAPEPPETGYDFFNYNPYLESWQNFVRYYLIGLFMLAYCCIKLIRAKDIQD